MLYTLDTSAVTAVLKNGVTIYQGLSAEGGFIEDVDMRLACGHDRFEAGGGG